MITQIIKTQKTKQIISDFAYSQLQDIVVDGLTIPLTVVSRDYLTLQASKGASTLTIVNWQGIHHNIPITPILNAIEARYNAGIQTLQGLLNQIDQSTTDAQLLAIQWPS